MKKQKLQILINKNIADKKEYIRDVFSDFDIKFDFFCYQEYRHKRYF